MVFGLLEYIRPNENKISSTFEKAIAVDPRNLQFLIYTQECVVT